MNLEHTRWVAHRAVTINEWQGSRRLLPHNTIQSQSEPHIADARYRCSYVVDILIIAVVFPTIAGFRVCGGGSERGLKTDNLGASSSVNASHAVPSSQLYSVH